MAVTPQHVLICRTDNIGDVVLTFPIASWLKRHFPKVKISFLCRAYAAGVARQYIHVDDVIEVEAFSGNPAAYFARAGIDTVIFAQPDQALSVAAFKARVKYRIGNSRHKLYQLFYCNRRVRFSKRISDLHESQFNFEYLRPFGLEHIPSLEEIASLYSFKEVRNERIARLLQPHPFNLILHPKSNGHGKEWPTDHYRLLADMLSAHEAVHLWITGSAAEGQWLQQHVPSLSGLPNVSNVCGQFSLEELTSFIQHADGLIASGTGPLHMSGALGQRTLGLFPPTRPMHPGRWAPVGKRARALCAGSGCAECKDERAITCDCMRSITPEVVADIVLAWVREAGMETSPPGIVPPPAESGLPALRDEQRAT